MRRDIRNPKLLYAKGALFLLLGLGSAAFLLARAPQWEVAILLAVSVWAFARAYYFAFYVVEKYADPAFRFSGLLAFAAYCIRGRPGAAGRTDPEPGP